MPFLFILGCEDAYTKDPSSIAACQTGCEYQKPSPVNGESPKTEKAPENANDDSFQEIQDAGMPFFTIQVKQPLSFCINNKVKIQMVSLLVTEHSRRPRRVRATKMGR